MSLDGGDLKGERTGTEQGEREGAAWRCEAEGGETGKNAEEDGTSSEEEVRTEGKTGAGDFAKRFSETSDAGK